MSGRIDAKEAVRLAIATMRELYPPEEIAELALEEVELVPDGQAWNVTLGMTCPDPKTAIEEMTGQAGARTYKVLRIEAEGGAVTSMKNRRL